MWGHLVCDPPIDLHFAPNLAGIIPTPSAVTLQPGTRLGPYEGREVVITERGRPVARLVPPTRGSAQPVPDLSAFRRKMPVVTPPLSASIVKDRGDRF